ncbi:hypothetical protein P171DRAFT_468363 [Karstenula rhodostoma CBS 690.94]|uniref:DUF7730 domain-containing protein n=1 Tax=Karstenula rhodostoma CBS 690.94 TaxID=1392251 RepID=A0A9P4UH94_9PLEO|nr:hypothetical protein P171DRAFT_468363 [Karstenula rhodostoma CBS 690.94]
MTKKKQEFLPPWLCPLFCCICVPCYPCTVPWALYQLSQFCRASWHRRNPMDIKRRKAERAARKAGPQSDLVVLGARPQNGGPAWLPKRDRPITPPPGPSEPDEKGGWKTISQTSAFFTKLPLEIRRKIYDFALGEEMLRVEVDGTRLDIWRCNGWTKKFWADDGGWKSQKGYGWKFLNYPPEEHKKGRKRKQRKAAINLLCTCRQVYLEAIGSIYESQTFVLAIGPHEERVHHHDKPTLLYLPYFILPQRLNQLRRLYIHWNLSPNVGRIGIADQTLDWWKECWHFLSTLQGLNELLIRFQSREDEQSRWDWEPLEAQLGECVRKIRVKKRFVVVLPFPENGIGNLHLDVGESKCENPKKASFLFRVPRVTELAVALSPVISSSLRPHSATRRPSPAMEATHHLAYSRHLAALEAARGKGTKPRTVPIFDAPCDCAECQLSHYPRNVQNIDAFCYVGSILRRWRNRSPSKRRALLLQIDTSLPKETYARFRLEYAQTTKTQHRREFRHVNLVPYLDAATPSMDPAVFIALLQYRTQSSPAEWASFDHQQLTVPWGSGLFDVHFNSQSVVMFGEDYGKLTPWEKEAAHRVDIIGFPRGRLILEAQSYLMSFLHKVVEEIRGPELEQECAATNWNHYVETGDHLELLQTEPSYLRRYAKVVGQMHLIDQNQKHGLGYQMIGSEICGDLALHWFWLGVCEEFKHAQSVHHRYTEDIDRGRVLPKEVDDALGALEVLLVNAVHERTMQLQALISQRPGFSHWYKHVPYDPTTKKAGYVLNGPGDTGDAFRKDPLWWCVMQLQGDPEDQTRFTYAMLFKYLDEHLASAKKSERSRLDEILYDKLSDYATIIELLAAVRMHFPKCAIRNIHEIMKTEDSGPRSEQWLENFNSLHETLQGFWHAVHDYYLNQNQKCGFSEKDIETLMQPVRIWKSESYMRLLAAKRDNILHDIANKKPSSIPNDDVWLPLPKAVGVEPRPDIPTLKDKVKTRGDQRDAPTSSNGQLPSEKDVVTNQIALTKRALKAFRLMFPTAPEDRKQDLDWDTFVCSMEEAGFKGRSGGGSIVSFEKVDGTGKINFHRPHPDPTLDPVMLQSMGRRINKWFGMTRDTFKMVGK